MKYDILMKGGYVIDPLNNLEKVLDIGIGNGIVLETGENLAASEAKEVFDVSGKLLMPGIVDMHMHASEWLGGPCSHKMLALAGVTAALDMSGPIEDSLNVAKTNGCGLTLAVLNRLEPGRNLPDNDPSGEELRAAIVSSLKQGAIGIKIMAGNFPLTPEATGRAIEQANKEACYVAIHAASTKTGSHIEGFLESLALAGDKHLHVAHINSYCRGLIRPYKEETEEAIEALIAHPNIVSESYLSPLNGNNGQCRDGVPIASVIRNCLKTGGYDPSETGFEKAILEGWARIHMVKGGQTVLCSGKEAVEFWKARNTDTGVSFLVNPPEPRYSLAVAKRNEGSFVVDAFSTDGGGIPRNVILSMGLSLVKFQAMTLSEFVIKASIQPGRIIGLQNHGHLGPGAAADITVVDYETQNPWMSIGAGKVIMYRGYVVGRGTRLLTTTEGAANAKDFGLESLVTDITQSGLYREFRVKSGRL